MIAKRLGWTKIKEKPSAWNSSAKVFVVPSYRSLDEVVDLYQDCDMMPSELLFAVGTEIYQWQQTKHAFAVQTGEYEIIERARND